jgi:maleamate amidohydrolase
MDEATRQIYSDRGLGGRQGAGTRPALVIVDLNRGFTDPASPLHCDTDAAVEATARLLEAAREHGCPVAFTTIQYDEAGKRVAKAFIDKVPTLLTLAPDTPWPEIDPRITPLASEPVLIKLFASAFFGTPLAPMLAAAHCDTIIITGASTSGCVRATAVDGMQYGYKVVVPRDAVADRAAAPHEANLFDIDAKYGDVVSMEDALGLLRSATFAEAEAVSAG